LLRPLISVNDIFMVANHLVLDSRQDFVDTQKKEQGVQQLEHNVLFERLGGVNWDDLHLIKTVAVVESFRQAAIKLGCSVNTVRARVHRLEKALDTTLFKRSREGISLSEDGLVILDVAMEMQSFSTRLQRGTGNNIVVQQGELRISCSEGIGSYWLTPRLGDLHEQLPNHVVVLDNDFDQNRIHSSDYDVRIGFAKPTDPEAIVKKLATVHQMLFASESYIAKYGMPASINDVRDHRLVLLSAPGVKSDAVSLFFGEDGARQLIAAKFNTGHSLLGAIANGIGIGALPTYARAISARLIPLDVPVTLKFELWLSFDRSGASSLPVREAINWAHRCFDQARYPWFTDEFIHPRAFEDRLANERNDHQLIW
jgi:DNA-binding transcriptional LysR family regulator